MKQYLQSETISPGEYTEADGVLYLAVKGNKSITCLAQCECKGFGRRYCTGLCYRWKNDDIVFKMAKEPKGDYSVVVTSTFQNLKS